MGSIGGLVLEWCTRQLGTSYNTKYGIQPYPRLLHPTYWPRIKVCLYSRITLVP